MEDPNKEKRNGKGNTEKSTENNNQPTEDYLFLILLMKQNEYDLAKEYNNYVTSADRQDLLEKEKITGNEVIAGFRSAKQSICEFFDDLHGYHVEIENIFDFIKGFVETTKDPKIFGNVMAFLNKGACSKELTREKCINALIGGCIGGAFASHIRNAYGDEIFKQTIEEFGKNPHRYLDCDCKEPAPATVNEDFQTILRICCQNSEFKDMWTDSKLNMQDIFLLFDEIRTSFIKKFDLFDDFTFTNHYKIGLKLRLIGEPKEVIVKTIGDYLIHIRTEGRFLCSANDTQKMYSVMMKSGLAGQGIGPIYWDFIRATFPDCYSAVEKYVEQNESNYYTTK